ncbi:hypothetical protein P378_05395 [Desulforamulus profundi]|uniref:Solute-binding protein family 5 domain-containing protein n=1 Tax=Desulforamulus profundi TaxID=1383067 RepID=A0A2C6MH69_9FIRM|nr:ABC transporter substrate-binding protein [Desulforamulus profundi]PHJ39095.1 hypothetical protein P378_05395 [Desulforamulus profundi]
MIGIYFYKYLYFPSYYAKNIYFWLLLFGVFQQSPREQIIRYNLCAEPKTLDPAKANGVPEATVTLQLFDGLTRYDANQQIQPALAESWQISDDGLTYTFKLREAKWSNGEPVKAQDFVYSWLRALAPETASEYAYQLYYIKGAEEYNSGKGKKEEVGIKALDDKTMQVVLRAPAPQFLGLTATRPFTLSTGKL